MAKASKSAARPPAEPACEEPGVVHPHPLLSPADGAAVVEMQLPWPCPVSHTYPVTQSLELTQVFLQTPPLAPTSHLNGTQSVVDLPSGAVTVWSPSHAATSRGMQSLAWVLHLNLAEQSASLAHELPHATPLHTNGSHTLVCGLPSGPHCPVPSHVAEIVSAPLPHDCDLHDTSAPTKPTQVALSFAPSHALAVHASPPIAPAQGVLPPCALPTTGEQVPFAVVTSQAWHCPAQA